MATVAEQAAGFKAILSASLSAVARCESEQPNDINPTASGTTRKAVIYPLFRELQYDQAFDGGAMYIWDLIVLAAPASVDPVRGQQAIDPYIDARAANSVPAVLYATTNSRQLGGKCDDLKITRAYDRGLIEVNAVNFWGVKLEVVTYD